MHSLSHQAPAATEAADPQHKLAVLSACLSVVFSSVFLCFLFYSAVGSCLFLSFLFLCLSCSPALSLSLHFFCYLPMYLSVCLSLLPPPVLCSSPSMYASRRMVVHCIPYTTHIIHVCTSSSRKTPGPGWSEELPVRLPEPADRLHHAQREGLKGASRKAAGLTGSETELKQEGPNAKRHTGTFSAQHPKWARPPTNFGPGRESRLRLPLCGAAATGQEAGRVGRSGRQEGVS